MNEQANERIDEQVARYFRLVSWLIRTTVDRGREKKSLNGVLHCFLRTMKKKEQVETAKNKMENTSGEENYSK